MKNVIFLLLLYSITATAQNIERLNQKNGYKSLLLGDTVTNLRGQTIPKLGFSDPNKDGIIIYFVTDSDILKINDNKSFEDVIVKYYKRKLYSIECRYNIKSELDLIDVLKLAYGEPTKKQNTSLLQYQWDGDKTLLLLMNLNTAEGRLVYFDRKLYKELLDKQKSNNSNAAKDF